MLPRNPSHQAAQPVRPRLPSLDAGAASQRWECSLDSQMFVNSNAGINKLGLMSAALPGVRGQLGCGEGGWPKATAPSCFLSCQQASRKKIRQKSLLGPSEVLWLLPRAGRAGGQGGRGTAVVPSPVRRPGTGAQGTQLQGSGPPLQHWGPQGEDPAQSGSPSASQHPKMLPQMRCFTSPNLPYLKEQKCHQLLTPSFGHWGHHWGCMLSLGGLCATRFLLSALPRAGASSRACPRLWEQQPGQPC